MSAKGNRRRRILDERAKRKAAKAARYKAAKKANQPTSAYAVKAAEQRKGIYRPTSPFSPDYIHARKHGPGGAV